MTEPIQQPEQSVAPTTTTQQDLVVASQRRINLIWEITQAVVAILITIATIYCEVNKIDSNIITAGFFLVIGVYLQRTNHNNIGGIGTKATDNQPNLGRSA